MHGFKSFANKEVMKLGQGITTVVGPNGCGKTNIVDAIRWVLGEQKYSVLRSGKMEDVIFNGTENTKPLGVCEVSMTVHNNSGKLPIDYNDIEIARRVYRSGESEYYLNKTQCRLKDIMDLFVDTGMGADAYSVIELKMIEQILSETADDRRKMFEEAAGIHKYRTQKKSTIRKFEATRNDLERIQDIIAEVEQKVRSLDLQLKRFKRHASLTEKLELKDIELAFLQVHRFNSSISPLRAKIKDFRHLRESKSNENSIHEKKLIELKNEYKKQEEDLNKSQSKMNEMNETREILRNDILVHSEKGRGALLTIERLEREKSNNFKKIGSLKQLSLDFDKELTELEPEIEEQLDKYKTGSNNFSQLDKDYKLSVKELDQLQNDRWDLQKKMADEQSVYDRTEISVSEKNEEIKTLQQNISDSFKLKDNELLKQKDLKNLKENNKKDLNQIETELSSLNSKLTDLNQNLERLSNKRHTNSALISSFKGQKDFYDQLVESRDGFPEGTRYVLENPKMFPDVLGTIADMFQVDQKYRDALESGLGDLSHCLVAKNRASAVSTVKMAREVKAGDLTIIPLEEAGKIKVDLPPMPNNGESLYRGSEIVKTSKDLQPLADYLLGKLLIVNNLNKFTQNDDTADWNIVDLGGNFSGNNLILKNRQISEHGNIIGREKRLGEIKKELESLLNKEKKNKKELELAIKSIDSCKSEINLLLEKRKNSRTISDNLQKDIIHNNLLIQQLDEKINYSKKELNDLKLNLELARKVLIDFEPKIEKSKKILDSFEKKVDQSNNKMLLSRGKRDDYQQMLQDIRIKLIELESRRDQLKFKKTSGEDSSDELKMRQKAILNEVVELKDKKTELDNIINSDEKKLKVINAEIQKQISIVDLKQSIYRETYQRIEEVQLLISNEQRDREKILEDLKNAELEATETEQKIQLIEERILDRYGSEIPKNLVVDSSEEQLELDIIKIQKSLENIGPVNMAVQDEYNDEIERFEMLNTQRDDLSSAEENLRETIRKIDKVARKRFNETFDLIKTNFEGLFNLFFEGGHATLKLIGDPDPLEADIAIQAQPPGKRNTSLRLLSSGEKALTAISLLFSIYQVKPSPYCILDEVDAPLDDVNIHKFTKVLEKFCDETQFIIVTHNKLTMEIADFMYGVTQESKGISKLVSVKFD
tara:strand:- start:400 stop:3900 length:3501 start_codon:yes stop_codon:yes gene_type:complete